MPEPLRQEIRTQASQAAWEAVIPSEMREPLLERAQFAEAARRAYATASHNLVEPAKRAALERYALERREAFYQGFECLDEQRRVTEVERVVTTRDTSKSSAAGAQQSWRFNSLREVLAVESLTQREEPVAQEHLLTRDNGSR